MSLATLAALLAGIAYGAVLSVLCIRTVRRLLPSSRHLALLWPGILALAGPLALASVFKRASQNRFDAHSSDLIYLVWVFSASSVAIFLVSFLCCVMVARRRQSIAAGS